MILFGQTKEEGNCLAINDALIVFPIDSLISIRLNEKGEHKEKLRKEGKASIRTVGSLLRVSEASDAVRNWNWRLARLRQMRLHWDKWYGNDESSYVKSMKQSHHFAAASLNFAETQAAVHKETLSLLFFSIFSLTNRTSTVHLCRVSVVAWLERADYKSLPLREL